MFKKLLGFVLGRGTEKNMEITSHRRFVCGTALHWAENAMTHEIANAVPEDDISGAKYLTGDAARLFCANRVRIASFRKLRAE